MPTKHLLIKGKVQGVFYRATAKDVAGKLGITGWIKNTEDGHVEAMVTGPELQLAQFINWCKQGPSRAVVASVGEKEVAGEIFDGFRVIRGQ